MPILKLHVLNVVRSWFFPKSYYYLYLYFLTHFWNILISAERKKCDHCSLTFFDISYLTKHCQEEHKESFEKEWIGCDVCKRRFYTKLSLTLHKCSVYKKENRGFLDQNYCNFCKNNFLKKSQFTSRISHCNDNHLDEVSKIWKLCDICGLYIPPNRMNVHNKSKHQLNNSCCPFCFKMITNNQFFLHCSVQHKKGNCKCNIMLRGQVKTAENINY